MPRIKFLPQNRVVEFRETASVLDLALKNGVDINHACGGMGSCTTCRIFVEKGAVTPLTELENERASEVGFLPNERLSCQVYPLSDLEVRVPDMTYDEGLTKNGLE